MLAGLVRSLLCMLCGLLNTIFSYPGCQAYLASQHHFHRNEWGSNSDTVYICNIVSFVLEGATQPCFQLSCTHSMGHNQEVNAEARNFFCCMWQANNSYWFEWVPSFHQVSSFSRLLVVISFRYHQVTPKKTCGFCCLQSQLNISEVALKDLICEKKRKVEEIQNSLREIQVSYNSVTS